MCYTLLVLCGWSAALAAIGAIVVTGAVGGVVELVLYAPLDRRRASSLVMLLTSLGLYIVVVNVIALLFGNGTKVVRSGVDQTYLLGDLVVSRVQLFQIGTALLVIPGFLIALRTTRWGKVLRAVRDNPQLAATTGFNVRMVRVLAACGGSALAGLTASLDALDVGMDPYGGMSVVLACAVIVIVGGVGRFDGVPLAAVLLGLIHAVVAWLTSEQWLEAATFAVLMVFLLVRPRGILAKSSRVEEPIE